MIGTLLALIPADRRGKVGGYAVLTVLSVLLRAVGVVLLVPLVAALFSPTPADAWTWLGWLTVLTVAGWVVDTVTARLGFDIGFAVLDRTQHDMADRLPNIRLDWLSHDNTATTRQAIAATGPELVGLVVNLLTPADRGCAVARRHRGCAAGDFGTIGPCGDGRGGGAAGSAVVGRAADQDC